MQEKSEIHLVHIYEEHEFAKELNELLANSFTVSSESDFEDGFSLIHSETSLIIISMPDVSQSLTNFLRQLKTSQFNLVPIVAIVNTDEQVYTRNILKMGFWDYYSRKYSVTTIVSQLTEFVTRQIKQHSIIQQLSFAIIDDDIIHSQLVKRLLENQKVKRIAQFESGEQFMNYATEFDVFLVDLVMKKMSGIKVISKIRQMFPKSIIMVISSIAEENIKTTAYIQGADDFLTKPMNPTVFIAKLSSRFQHK